MYSRWRSVEWTQAWNRTLHTPGGADDGDIIHAEGVRFGFAKKRYFRQRTTIPCKEQEKNRGVCRLKGAFPAQGQQPDLIDRHEFNSS